MATIIPWEEHDIQLIGTCENGIEALELIARHRPDIVITDIKMPKMDGLALLKNIREQWDGIEVIIISGFEEFEYAKKAINFGARNYILKPIEPAELLNAVKEASERIQQLRTLADPETEDEIGNILHKMIYSEYPSEAYNTIVEKHPELRHSWFVVLVLQMDNLLDLFGKKPDSLYTSLSDELTRYCQSGNDFYFLDRNPHNMILVSRSDTSEEAEKNAGCLASMIQSFFHKHSYPSYAVGISLPHLSTDNLGKGFLEAVRYANLKYVYGNERIYRADEEYKMDYQRYSVDYAVIEEIVAATTNYDQDAVNRILTRLFEVFQSKKVCLFDAQQFVRNVISCLMNQSIFSSISLNEIYPDVSACLSTLFTSDTVDDLQKHLLSFLHMVGAYLVKNKAGNTAQIVNRVKKYIRKNYQSPGLSLMEISRSVNFSPAYLSSIFNKECGYGITTYINQTRIDMAIRLLVEGNDQISVISEKVGYLNTNYFGVVFKKYTGLSPSEYRILNS